MFVCLLHASCVNIDYVFMSSLHSSSSVDAIMREISDDVMHKQLSLWKMNFSKNQPYPKLTEHLDIVKYRNNSE